MSGALGQHMLEALQRKAHAETLVPFPDIGEILSKYAETVREVWLLTGEGYSEQWLADKANLPTPIQNPITFGTIVDLQRSLNRAAGLTGVSLPDDIIVGTAPTGGTNARTVAVRGESPLIVFDDGVFTFAWLCSKAVSQLLLVHGDGAIPHMSTRPASIWSRHVETSGEAMYRLRNAMLAYIVRGNPAAASHYVLVDPWEAQAASNLAVSWELFALAHEFGHVTLKHPFGAVDDSRQQREREADAFALELVLAGSPSMMEGVVGCFLYLQCSALLERAISYMHSGVDEPLPSQSHPPPTERMVVLQQAALPSGCEEVFSGLSYALEVYYWPTLVGAIDVALRERNELVHLRWQNRLSPK